MKTGGGGGGGGVQRIMALSKGDDLKCRRPKKYLRQWAWSTANKMELKTEPLASGKLGEKGTEKMGR